MTPNEVIDQLAANASVFDAMLRGTGATQLRWKPAENKWSLLEVVCHLYDEEREDFRARLKHTLATPELPLPLTDPERWVTERNYASQNYEEMLARFLKERAASVEWLRSLSSPKWDNAWVHPKIGPLTAEMFLANWLAHDYLHIRQIDSLKYNYLLATTQVRFDYAGTW